MERVVEIKVPSKIKVFPWTGVLTVKMSQIYILKTPSTTSELKGE
jgi:hypothetical protein